jgi:hypothetical protein
MDGFTSNDGSLLLTHPQDSSVLQTNSVGNIEILNQGNFMNASTKTIK